MSRRKGNVPLHINRLFLPHILVLPNLIRHFYSFQKFLKSTDFSRGVLMATAGITSLAAAYFLENMAMGVAMAIGALVSSPSDVPGSLKRRCFGIFASIVLAVCATLISGYSSGKGLIFIPILALLIFWFSLLAAYGFRASLIAFSGMFALVLSLAKVPAGEMVLIHSLWIGLGGLWYLTLSVLLHISNPSKQAEELMAEGFRLTSEYLKVRAELIDSSAEQREELKKQLFQLQSDINEKHETIRELVISRRARSGRSGGAQKKMLIFIELVDILELSMANPVKYEQMEELFQDQREKLQIIQEWSFLMADELLSISDALEYDKVYAPNPDLETLRLKAKLAIDYSWNERNFSGSGHTMLVLRSLIDFKEKQQEKIFSIARLLHEFEVPEEIVMKDKDALKFITGQEYSLKILQDNLDFSSPIFRHSLRLAIVILSGYTLGSFFELQNTYWILLTSLVIMRPGYALTKERSKQRLYGTLIGAAIAISLVLITRNVVVFAVLAVITLVLALSMLQRNYKASAIFITLNIVLVYSIITPDPFQVIRFRIIDTLLGAGLAFLGNSFLWPTWEYRAINNFIARSLQANEVYLMEIHHFYVNKEKLQTSYKLARKQAFLAMGNLNAAFQRMTQEPKSKQKEVGSTYRIVSLNQEFLSSAASLGTFIRTHRTTKPSSHFISYIQAIRMNLRNTRYKLEEKKLDETISGNQIEEASVYFDRKYEELVEIRHSESLNLREGQKKISGEMNAEFQELQLVRDQLKWLLQISQNLKSQVFNNKKPPF